MAAFLVSFLLLSLAVHLIYRAKTQRWQHSWLDFMVAEENGKRVAQRIGKFYYAAVVLNRSRGDPQPGAAARMRGGAPCAIGS